MPSRSSEVLRSVKIVRWWHATRSLALVATVALAASVWGWAGTLVVSKTNPPCIASTSVYTTIQAAVTAATSGSTIDVCPGTYPEQVLITIPLTLTGAKGGNADNPLITAPTGGVVANTTVNRSGTPYSSAAQVLVHGTTGVTVKNLSVDGSNSGITDCNTGIVGIYYQNASGKVSSVVVQNQVGFTNCGRGLGVYVETDGTATSTVTIQNSLVRFTSGLNIGATSSGTTATISGNSVIGSSVSLDNGIYVAGGATGIVSGNTIMNFVVPDALGDNKNGICGIQITKASNLTISGNTVSSTNCAISMAQGTSLTITGNKIMNTVDVDGIYICGNSNIVQHNIITGSDDAAIRLDNTAADFCTGFGNNNTITGNTINGSCVGVLEPTGTTGNLLTPNTYNNVQLLQSANKCP